MAEQPGQVDLGATVRRRDVSDGLPETGMVVEMVRDGWLVNLGKDHALAFCENGDLEFLAGPDAETQSVLDAHPTRDKSGLRVTWGWYVVRARDLRPGMVANFEAVSALRVARFGYISGVGIDSYAVVWHDGDPRAPEYMGHDEVQVVDQRWVPPSFNRFGR